MRSRRVVSLSGLLEATVVVLTATVFILEAGLLYRVASRVAFADRGSAHASDSVRGVVTP